jgi:hypothetical protein
MAEQYKPYTRTSGPGATKDLHGRPPRASPTNGKNAQNSIDQCSALSLITWEEQYEPHP